MKELHKKSNSIAEVQMCKEKISELSVEIENLNYKYEAKSKEVNFYISQNEQLKKDLEDYESELKKIINSHEKEKYFAKKQYDEIAHQLHVNQNSSEENKHASKCEVDQFKRDLDEAKKKILELIFTNDELRKQKRVIEALLLKNEEENENSLASNKKIIKVSNNQIKNN